MQTTAASSNTPMWLAIGEAAVLLCAVYLASVTDLSSGRGQQLFTARCIVGAASAVGIARYGPWGMLTDLHFFFRQLANALPIVVMCLAVLSKTAAGAWAAPLLAREGDVLLAAATAALMAFFTGNETYTKLVQVPAFLALAGGVCTAVAAEGLTGPPALLALGVAIFAVREFGLRAALPLSLADPLRRFTLVAALLTFSSALA